MELWHGDLPDFLNGARGPKLAASMAERYGKIYRRAPAPERNTPAGSGHSLRLQRSPTKRQTDDIGVLVEYHLPLSERRIDVMLFGRRHDGQPNSLLIELKRWDARRRSKTSSRSTSSTGDVEHVHPSQQALDYAGYLEDTHSEYSTGRLSIAACSYLHEMSPDGTVLRDPRFAELLKRSPAFFSGDEASLATLLNAEVGHRDGVALMHDVRGGLFRPSRKLVEELDAVLRHDSEWHLLEEQRKAYNAIWAEVQRVRHHQKRSAVLVRGGPGTGKSVIAIQLLAEALRNGLSAVHSTGGKAFTLVMQGTFTGAHPLFVWNRSLRRAKPLELDLLLADEAHRIRETSDDRFTKMAERNRRTQIDELLDASKVSVFFLDEHQYMRPDEVGSSALVREATARRKIPLREYDLATQFRCGGSREYVDWVDNLLGFRAEAPAGHLGTAWRSLRPPMIWTVPRFSRGV